MNSIDPFVASLRSLDWEDIDGSESATSKALESLATNRDILRDTLRALPDQPELFALCEHYDILDKIVLYADEQSGIRLRLHVFLPGYFDRPHNHRWSYASRILRGEYRHYLYGDVVPDESLTPEALRPVQVRQEYIGASYALHHTMVHAVVAEPYSVSLVVRGPAVKNRFFVMDRKTGMSWWQYGASQEPAEESALKRMTRARLDELWARLDEWGLF